MQWNHCGSIDELHFVFDRQGRIWDVLFDGVVDVPEGAPYHGKGVTVLVDGEELAIKKVKRADLVVNEDGRSAVRTIVADAICMIEKVCDICSNGGDAAETFLDVCAMEDEGWLLCQ